MIDQIGHVYSKYQELQQKLGHDPKVEELAAAMDMTVEKVREAFRASANPISLETPVGSDEENTLGDLLSNQQEEAPADVAERTLLSDYLDDALEELTPRERMVLRMRFGISDQRPRTLGEIGQVIGVSRERVRQLEAEAIAKLRRPNLRLRLGRISGVAATFPDSSILGIIEGGPILGRPSACRPAHLHVRRKSRSTGP